MSKREFKQGQRVVGYGHLGHKYYGEYSHMCGDGIHHICVEYRRHPATGSDPLDGKVCAFNSRSIVAIKPKAKLREWELLGGGTGGLAQIIQGDHLRMDERVTVREVKFRK